jgi:hypothetical protein
MQAIGLASPKRQTENKSSPDVEVAGQDKGVDSTPYGRFTFIRSKLPTKFQYDHEPISKSRG